MSGATPKPSAPPSGSVLVTASFIAVQGTASATAGVALAAHGTVTPLIGYAVGLILPNTAGRTPATVPFLVTGLASGSSYTFDLLSASSSGSDQFQIYALGSTSTTNSTPGGPVVMTVQAV